ncbi:MAG: hypothetical protein AB8B53_03205 [Flavobacteriales bacterium]
MITNQISGRLSATLCCLITICSLSLNSCTKEEDLTPSPVVGTSYSYSETQCADPWHQFEGAFDLTPEERVMAYFESLDIEVSNIEFLPLAGDLEACLACTCLSGNIINLDVAPEAEETIENLGFIVTTD